MKILITGTAGFIGFHLVQKIVNDNVEIVGLDNINNYYDPRLKFSRLSETGINEENIVYDKLIPSVKYKNYKFIKLDLEDKQNIDTLFKEEQFDFVCNLAAQAGVRYSLINPGAYINSNIVGFFNMLEASRANAVKHFTYASSSSVYGLNEKMPYSVSDNVDHPISLYAASKKSNELIAHSYSHIYNLPTTGVRFFTAYGPWGRPDMALFTFSQAIIENKTIDVYNFGKMKRDFTYVDDIIEGLARIIFKPAVPNKNWDGNAPNPSSSRSPFKVYNIGYNSPVSLMDFIKEIENVLVKKAKLNLCPIQPGDVPATYADITELVEHFDYKPSIPLEVGIERFIAWFKSYYKHNNN